LNEGHAAFAVLERAYSYMRETSLPFDAALSITRVGNIFTTHTAVAAGFDRFAPGLIDQYLGRYAREKLGISIEELLALGRRDPNDSSESFSMAYLAVRGSGSVNGVSRLHGEVSRRLFEPVFPRWPQGEVPIGHVTNGVHMPTWQSAAADELWTESCGEKRWTGLAGAPEDAVRTIPDDSLWEFRTSARRNLIDFARKQLSRQLAVSGMPEAIEAAKHRFNPDALTLGFARRFATYKRPNLLLHNPERLMRILTDSMRPVQLIMAGKAHPEDRTGQELIHQWINFIRQTDVRLHIIFLSDYDMFLTGRLVQGVDVWINTPQRPWEASGTSGMKVLVNGGLNLSELDGWWAEAYTPELGWALGDGQEHFNDPDLDALEADALYELLELEVVPEFYTRSENGVPAAWVKRIRESMTKLTPQYSADRAVREYTDEHYLPAAAEYRLRSASKGAVGKQILDWRRKLDRRWPTLHFGAVKIETHGEQHLFEVEVCLNGLDSMAIRVELYADGVMGGAPSRDEMKCVRTPDDASGRTVYSASVSASRPREDYTARVIPFFEGVAIPLEDSRILWQR
jgi:starch phosphorylase